MKNDKIRINDICVGIESEIIFYYDYYTTRERICILEKTKNSLAERDHILINIYKDLVQNEYLYISKDGVILPKGEEVVYVVNNIKPLKKLLEEFIEKKESYPIQLDNFINLYNYIMEKTDNLNKKFINEEELNSIIKYIEALYCTIAEDFELELEFELEEEAEEIRSGFYLVRGGKKS